MCITKKIIFNNPAGRIEKRSYKPDTHNKKEEDGEQKKKKRSSPQTGRLKGGENIL